LKLKPVIWFQISNLDPLWRIELPSIDYKSIPHPLKALGELVINCKTG